MQVLEKEKEIINKDNCIVYIFENYMDWDKQLELYKHCEKKQFEFDKPLGGFLGKNGAKQRRGVYMESIENIKGYEYSGQIVKSYKMDSILQVILKNINDKINCNLNSFFMNFYRDNGTDYIGAHSDDESQMGENSTFATLTLTDNKDCIRIMRFKNKNTSEKIDIKLYPGSLLIMSGKTQQKWTHEIPKSKKIKGNRISLTTRKFLNN